MDKVYEQYGDQHVVATKVYVKTGDAYAYADSNKTVKIKAADLQNLFEKGLLIVDGTIEYKPVSFKLAAGVGTVTYVKTDGTTPTTAVLATLASFDAA
jgi:hypothetical protein